MFSEIIILLIMMTSLILLFCLAGAGPCGLRMAVEMQYLGAKTTVIESRPYMDRNNVIKLWGFVMEDLKGLGAKKLYSQFGNGSVNHIPIRMLQLILLKIALLLGAAVYIRESFLSVSPPAGGKGWSVVTEVKCRDGAVFHCLEEFDIIICATGRSQADILEKGNVKTMLKEGSHQGVRQEKSGR